MTNFCCPPINDNNNISKNASFNRSFLNNSMNANNKSLDRSRTKIDHKDIINKSVIHHFVVNLLIIVIL